MPRSAKTTMKRKRRKIREMIDFMEFIREMTRFLRDAQYLDGQTDQGSFLSSLLTYEYKYKYESLTW